MNIYMAAVYTNAYRAGCNWGLQYTELEEHEKQKVDSIPHILESYHYVQKQKFVEAMRTDKAKVFMDSGAFSAYTLGVELTVAEYCKYVQENIDLIRVEDGALMASVLDGIGDPLQTYRNQLEMEARGVRPLPCFHAGEDERYLEYYITNYDYITLGGMVGTSSKQLMTWLDRMWDRYLTDGSGRPRVKVHGFGITARQIMEAYPWYSCDSSSWIQTASFGGITTPQWGDISVSEKSPARHTKGQHAGTLTPLEQDVLFQYLEANGFTYERLSQSYQSRAAFNLWSYGVINAMVNAAASERFKSRVQELF